LLVGLDCSRQRKTIANDADRLRKYLARFDLDWSTLKERLTQE
jgi:transcriptional regulatory protein RtcR